MATKIPIPLRWWAFLCYGVGGLLMYNGYIGDRASESSPYSIYTDGVDQYWMVIKEGRSGDWYEEKSNRRVSRGSAALRATLGGGRIQFQRRSSTVDLKRFPATDLQFHLDADSAERGGLRVAMQTGLRTYCPADGLPLGQEHIVSEEAGRGFVVLRVPIASICKDAVRFAGFRFTAPSAPADLNFYFDEVQMLPARAHGN